MNSNPLPELPVVWESISTMLEWAASSGQEIDRELSKQVQGLIREVFGSPQVDVAEGGTGACAAAKSEEVQK